MNPVDEVVKRRDWTNPAAQISAEDLARLRKLAGKIRKAIPGGVAYGVYPVAGVKVSGGVLWIQQKSGGHFQAVSDLDCFRDSSGSIIKL